MYCPQRSISVFRTRPINSVQCGRGRIRDTAGNLNLSRVFVICCDITSSAVIPSVTRGRAKMQKTITQSLTRSTESETDGHAMVITVALRCGESVVKLIIRGGVSISLAPCLPCNVALIDTIMFKPLYVDVILSYRSFDCH